MCCFGLSTPFVDWLVPPIIGGWFYIPIVHSPRLVVVVSSSIVEYLHRYLKPRWFIAASGVKPSKLLPPLLLAPDGTLVAVIPMSEQLCLTFIATFTFTFVATTRYNHGEKRTPYVHLNAISISPIASPVLNPMFRFHYPSLLRESKHRPALPWLALRVDRQVPGAG